MSYARTSARAGLRRRGAPAHAQRGVVVFIALIVLVAMMLAGVAVMRSSGSAILTAGNLAFRQNATTSGDVGLEAARTWLSGQGPVTLQGPVAASGYCDTWTPDFKPFDPATWTQCGTAPDPVTAITVRNAGTDSSGNTVTFVIHRMCKKPGPVGNTGGQECVTVSDPGKGGPKRAFEGGEKALTGATQPYYRVTARIAGPKNTVSYVQTMLY
jgi:Tfp pilus assembly protein PilX